MSEEIKKIVENAKSEDEFLENPDKVSHPLSDEELAAVAGGVITCGSNTEACYPVYHIDN